MWRWPDRRGGGWIWGVDRGRQGGRNGRSWGDVGSGVKFLGLRRRRQRLVPFLQCQIEYSGEFSHSGPVRHLPMVSNKAESTTE